MHFTLKFLALKKLFFTLFRGQKSIFSIKRYYATFQCWRYNVFKENLEIFFYPEKVIKQALKVAHYTLLFHSPAQTTTHSPELIFHIIKSRDQTFVLLSVLVTFRLYGKIDLSFYNLCINSVNKEDSVTEFNYLFMLLPNIGLKIE